ncbi:MAG: hypothetical protein IPI07_11185 [Flavobacteriales bacterium]|nr:hypothetical protein [Flavobacteriales bacterium]
MLTQGAGLTIVNAGATPSFEISAIGDYTIHTLVYDPNTLDLSIVELGVTTGFDERIAGTRRWRDLREPGCGRTCPAVSRVHQAPLSGGADVCGTNGAATLTATANGDANVPAGYSTVYVLTQGAGLTIVNAGAAPSFDVTEDGLYTITPGCQ